MGSEHAGLGLDFVCDHQEPAEHICSRPYIFPADKDYKADAAIVEPERIPLIAEGLLKRGYTQEQVKGILGSARVNLGKEEVRCNERKLFDGIHRSTPTR